jgi:hypothetical protein
MQTYTAEDLIETRKALGLSRRAACYLLAVPYGIWTEWEKGCGYGTPPPILFAALNIYANACRIQEIFSGKKDSVVQPCLHCNLRKHRESANFNSRVEREKRT